MPYQATIDDCLNFELYKIKVSSNIDHGLDNEYVIKQYIKDGKYGYISALTDENGIVREFCNHMNLGPHWHCGSRFPQFTDEIPDGAQLTVVDCITEGPYSFSLRSVNLDFYSKLLRKLTLCLTYNYRSKSFDPFEYHTSIVPIQYLDMIQSSGAKTNPHWEVGKSIRNSGSGWQCPLFLPSATDSEFEELNSTCFELLNCQLSQGIVVCLDLIPMDKVDNTIVLYATKTGKYYQIKVLEASDIHPTRFNEIRYACLTTLESVADFISYVLDYVNSVRKGLKCPEYKKID